MIFHVIDKRTGKEPIFDYNHIFKEKWFKESGLIYCDIDGWYISEDGQLALIDDCGKCVWVDQDRFKVVVDEPTVCDIEQIKAEIEETIDSYVCDVETNTPKAQGMINAKIMALEIIDKYTKGGD